MINPVGFTQIIHNAEVYPPFVALQSAEVSG